MFVTLDELEKAYRLGRLGDKLFSNKVWLRYNWQYHTWKLTYHPRIILP